MPETPEQLWERARGSLRMPPVHEWRSWPFEGELRPAELQPPVEREAPRRGEGGIDCFICGRADEEYLWTDERWRVAPPPQPTGLPVVVFLEPRVHCDFGSIPEELIPELGPMLVRVEAAVRAVPHLGRIHVCRWGDGSEHLHWWFMGRPARLPQVIGTQPRSGTTSCRPRPPTSGRRTSRSSPPRCAPSVAFWQLAAPALRRRSR